VIAGASEIIPTFSSVNPQNNHPLFKLQKDFNTLNINRQQEEQLSYNSKIAIKCQKNALAGFDITKTKKP
jgi:hypothetical protein